MILVNSTYYAAIFIFMIGLVLKFLRTPFHTVIMLVAILGLVIAGVVYFIHKKNEMGLAALASVAFSGSLLSLLKYWPNTLSVGLLILGCAITLLLIFKRPKTLKHLGFAGIMLLLVIGFGSMSKSTRYYWVSIRYNLHIETDALTWNKYAWMLNLDQKREEAAEALEQARSIAAARHEEDLVKILDQQKAQLAAGNWRKFR